MLTFKEFVAEGQRSININMNRKELISHIESKGWTLTRTKGIHDIYNHPDSTLNLPVPRHKDVGGPGTIRQIIKDSGTFNKKKAA